MLNDLEILPDKENSASHVRHLLLEISLGIMKYGLTKEWAIMINLFLYVDKG